MQLCGVCIDQIPKYRCPVCRVRYCSLGCFKKHKNDDSCQPIKDTTPPASPDETPFPDIRHSGAEQPWTVDDLLDEDNQSDRVPLQRLQQLGESKALMNLLQNPHLRQVMMEVDSAQDKDKAMKKAMQEPLFVEFADQCLQIMEPTEKVEETDDGY
ncbi:zinc finger HIT domain-containing protein 3 [Brachyhypopomus gauderio]|uniref:zinc finger HIT domain-containing protein 3 n=1 Tax=Brachyhypopomus gauderio TaxID=698409 RepID=UPI004042E9C0